MLLRNTKTHLLSLAVIAALTGAVVVEAAAQESRSEQRRNKGGKAAKEEPRYPNATREEPKAKPAPKLQKKFKALFDAFNDSEYETARPLAQELVGAEAATDYDKALANFLAAQIAYNLDDNAAAKTYAQTAIDLNALGNDNHFGAMLFLAQLYMQDDEFAQSLTVLDKYFAETKSQKPEDLVIKGNALYRSEKPAEAIPFLRQAIDATPEPKNDWLQLLMASYADAGQNAEAIKLAAQLAEKNPNDKRAALNLSSVYQQADQFDKSAEVLEKLRAAGQFTEERDYKLLYTTYANLDGQEKKVIEVINDGLAKGLLKPDYNSYVALAQSYYYTDQIPQAIDAWKKGAPLAPSGETYLNLARVLQGEGRIAEAKEAARQAKAKGGLRKPEDADKILKLK